MTLQLKLKICLYFPLKKLLHWFSNIHSHIYIWEIFELKFSARYSFIQVGTSKSEQKRSSQAEKILARLGSSLKFRLVAHSYASSIFVISPLRFVYLYLFQLHRDPEPLWPLDHRPTLTPHVLRPLRRPDVQLRSPLLRWLRQHGPRSVRHGAIRFEIVNFDAKDGAYAAEDFGALWKDCAIGELIIKYN